MTKERLNHQPKTIGPKPVRETHSSSWSAKKLAAAFLTTTIPFAAGCLNKEPKITTVEIVIDEPLKERPLEVIVGKSSKNLPSKEFVFKTNQGSQRGKNVVTITFDLTKTCDQPILYPSPDQ